MGRACLAEGRSERNKGNGGSVSGRKKNRGIKMAINVKPKSSGGLAMTLSGLLFDIL